MTAEKYKYVSICVKPVNYTFYPQKAYAIFPGIFRNVSLSEKISETWQSC